MSSEERYSAVLGYTVNVVTLVILALFSKEMKQR